MSTLNHKYFLLAITAAISLGGFELSLIAARLDWYSDMMITIFFAGSVGGVVNNYFRIEKISEAGNENSAELSQIAVSTQIFIAPLMSGILGLVAYGIFLSGLMSGPLFPAFNNLDQPFQGLGKLLSSVDPKTNLDGAKAIIWSFIAGFSERLIPNVLDRLATKAEDSLDEKS